MLEQLKAFTEISIHALREEGDRVANALPGANVEFLSTPSARRATDYQIIYEGQEAYFYPRPPRGGRHLYPSATSDAVNFYPRPPRGGRRKNTLCIIIRIVNFYPRPPRGGRHPAHHRTRQAV